MLNNLRGPSCNACSRSVRKTRAALLNQRCRVVRVAVHASAGIVAAPAQASVLQLKDGATAPWEDCVSILLRLESRVTPVVLLIHGYGASVYHWRYQFQELAGAGFNVYALDLIGFGLSEKASIDYSNAKPWISQISEFIKEVIGGGPVVLVGNSLGAYASLATAAARPDLISAVAMLNGAGPMRDGRVVPPPSALDPVKKAINTAVKRVALYFGFLYAKQPLRIKQVLDLVYVSKDQIDQDLVTSIQVPAADPNAADVFFRVNNQSGTPTYVDDLLEGFTQPLLLLWGDADPWIVPARGRKVQELYPAADLRLIPSGHCPHDDTPELANQELLRWLRGLPHQQQLLAQVESAAGAGR